MCGEEPESRTTTQLSPGCRVALVRRHIPSVWMHSFHTHGGSGTGCSTAALCLSRIQSRNTSAEQGVGRSLRSDGWTGVRILPLLLPPLGKSWPPPSLVGGSEDGWCPPRSGVCCYSLCSWLLASAGEMTLAGFIERTAGSDSGPLAVEPVNAGWNLQALGPLTP